ncbi:purine-nucleoside phosphorylase [Riemerella anatipestifer]|uniref:Purine nucleoside phosphorylase n=1 Tax=Riemerella anatipestifer (strain ATCC 11845 / DSM 15868 / JCM 9532 / NCTC 11014) TaxID=693978 RepID=E4TBJ4_RIEAD|nr:purine-nucleoside phosphorylase [Riemerella anatipestifer]ADQ81823.1 purine nucleoside phosphorylase I, inosine and guanosine-specific [Riemerella anatipestifer ATCC 11845 = DSM 15868]ADZ12676.1 Purine nucleoside phosphorylase [Riemerella anatipestifer RA-GD]AFD55833.1 purine nucleoside phosphorylase i, inosine and guanosine-specific [Riemerella anatipestifer ATCC 11845 = DSM 15868]AGC40263.1 Purine nucleoside phosphorylase [Riemerella anatipestifer RA-CH-2]AKP69063.1 purine nucleoside phos
MLEKFKETAAFIKNIIGDTPDFAIVLGSGLGKLKDEVEAIHTLDYADIPNFPQTTVVGHGGSLIYGTLEGKKVLMMSGRFHYYEGHSIETVTFPFRVFHLLGIKNLIVSNASGGVNPNFKVADVMLINDHINMMPEHPLRGKNIDELGPRFVDMSEPYNRKMLSIAEEVAKENNITVHQGVYVALQGPTFETPAEYGLIRAIGGDAVGMSTVPEVIVAKHQGMDVFGISIITDLGGPEIAFNVSHEEVLEAANKAMPNVIKIVKGLVKNY